MKQYKACAPEQTIVRIRGILAEMGLFLNEWNMSHGEDLFNCRLSYINDGLESLGVGNNGKGRSYLYALASGYAEIMERLQNGIHFDLVRHHRDMRMIAAQQEGCKKGWLTRFDSLPVKSLRELEEEFETDLRQLFPGVDDFDKFFYLYYDTQRVPTSEMFSVDDCRMVEFPLSLARIASATNGMCAGNTPEEALLHGFCEIFERYAAQRIMRERITPPTIPTNYFKGSAPWRTIQRLERSGLSITVKDCSLGLGMPVVGVLIINPNSGRYNFRLGSEFVAEYALERCLTEVYQNGDDEFQGMAMQHFEREKTREEWHFALKRGKGLWPDEIFSDIPSLPLWQFPDEYGRDDRADLRRCLDICRSLGSKAYIRNNSFLGFPSYHIIVPNMSRVLYDFDDIPEEIFYDRQQIAPFLFEEGEVTAERLIQIVEPWAHRAAEKGTGFDLCSLIPAYKNDDLRSITPRIFLALVALYRKDRAQALRLLEEECRRADGNPFANALADWLALTGEKAITSLSVAEAQKRALGILTRKYGQGFALKAAIWLSRPEDCIRNSGLLNHFQPQNFTLEAPGRRSASSHLEAYEKISDRLAARAAAFRPDYAKLAEIFK